ncbi:unnamed protein product [Effrenium voratum]|uniref:ATP-grasp domain-containing protein n=1 Tax=Effrenium voratum TaxID=2562239 RepID=A0AA36NHH0_9DINO|nr:unnamed protein product [Effrenium voratum]
MTGKRRPSKGMSCPLPRTFALLGLCVFWGCAWLVMQWKTLQFSPARPPSPDAEDVPGPVPEKAVKPPKSIKTNPSRGHPSRGHQVHPGAHKSQVASCPQRPRRKEKWGEVVKEDMKIIKSSATAVQSCHRLGDALVYELRFLEAHKKEGFAYELLLPDYVVADEAGAGLERRSTLQLLAATGKGLQPLGPAHSSQEQVAKGDGSFGHWREPMERGFEHTASRLRFSTPGNVPLKELTRLVAVVFPMVPAMGFVEVVHKPDKKAKDYDPTKRRRRKELHRELFFEAFPRVGAQPHLADRPEETKPGVSYLWRTSHHDEFHLELQLFTVDSSGHFHPLGPAHSAHSFIAEHGDGAYSHWRPGITNSTYGKAMLLFSTPRNVAIKKLSLAAVVYPMLPPMGWIEFNQGKKVNHEELFREMFLQSFAAAGVSRPHLIEQADEAIPGTRYLWRVGGNSEFQLPLADGELYEKRLPYQIAEWYAEFERKGGILYPPPHTYIYYQNKVGLARLFNERKVKIPPTWVFESLSEAEAELENIKFPVVIKDPYGFSSMHLLQAADKEEFLQNCQLYFEKALPGVEAIVQSKVVAMREARVTYIEGRPFHGYWRIRQSLKSASAASNLGGYQDFDFPLSEIAPYVAEFANLTGIPVGGVDFIWEEEKANVTVVPYTLEVSPTSDINPPAPTSWTKTYSEFKHTKGYRRAYLDVRRSWTDLMTLAVIDKYRQERKNLFVDIDNVVAKSMERVRRWKGSKKAYLASEVMQDEVVEGAVEALRRLQARYFIRFLTARGSYEDPFNVTQTWLDSKGFEYDELIVVHGPESKVAHLTSETILVDDFTTSHEKEEPATNQKFMDQLSAAGLPFVKFPLGGRWDDIMEKLLPSG